MSKLGETIRKTLRTEAAPMGFRAVRRAPNRSLAVAVQLDGVDAERAAVAAQGADALLFRLDKGGESALEAALKAAGDLSCGVWPGEVDAEAVKRLVEKGVDYLVFEIESTPASALLADDAGYVLALEGDHDDTYLRTLDALTLDAVFLPGWKGVLTVQRQLELRRIAGLTRKPLMLPVSLSVESGELECLRDAGVAVLVLDGREKEAIAALGPLRERVEALPAVRRPREHADVILPSAIGMMADEEEEEEEGEEE
ncbi:MAG: hypothetical protein ABR978_00895 [Dehalococcoidia bacterium]|jgi:hypothetical protein